MLNIYGETVKLTKAQRQMYVDALRGKFTVYRDEKRRMRTALCLKRKALLKVVHVTVSAISFERWT